MPVRLLASRLRCFGRELPSFPATINMRVEADGDVGEQVYSAKLKFGSFGVPASGIHVSCRPAFAQLVGMRIVAWRVMEPDTLIFAVKTAPPPGRVVGEKAPRVPHVPASRRDDQPAAAAGSPPPPHDPASVGDQPAEAAARGNQLAVGGRELTVAKRARDAVVDRNRAFAQQRGDLQNALRSVYIGLHTELGIANARLARLGDDVELMIASPEDEDAQRGVCEGLQDRVAVMGALCDRAAAMGAPFVGENVSGTLDEIRRVLPGDVAVMAAVGAVHLG